MKAKVLKRKSGLSLGVDIESTHNFPEAGDYRKHTFYQDNFSSDEIMYCCAQSDPTQSFAGLFCAKEAMVKADNTLRGIPFCEIHIAHTDSGKPVVKGFAISISHANDFAVAIAVKVQDENNTTTKPGFALMLSLLFSILALAISLLVWLS